MKYKIRFKANDSLSYEEVKHKVVVFLQEKYQQYAFKVKDIGPEKNLFIYTIITEEFGGPYVEFGVAVDSMTVGKSWTNSAKFIELDKEEMKFFSSLGFEVTDFHKQSTGHNVDDWF